MFSKIASASLIGLSCLAVVSAAPFSFDNNPLGNNFPTPSADQLAAIETQAHGSLPLGNAPPPPPNGNTILSQRLIQFNENFEVSYFATMLSKMKSKAPGFWDDKRDMNFLIDTITAVLAQEELHAINAGNFLTKFDSANGPVLPCQYLFPVDNLDDAIALASTFTDVVLGTLQDVATFLGKDGDAGAIRGVASVIGQEGEQNGFYRQFGGKIPSALPFLTASTRDFAFSALNQNFIVPGSCPNFNSIDLKVFGTLTVETPAKDIKPQAQTIEFSFQFGEGGLDPAWKSDCSGLELVFINQQNVPKVAKLESVHVDLNAHKVTFSALFPFDAATFGNGLTLAAVVNPSGADLTTVDGVAAATAFGPGLIEIN